MAMVSYRMEREPQQHQPLLTEAIAQDYPDADEVLVSFAEKWQFVQRIQAQDTVAYVAAMPPNQELPRDNRFHSLPPEINETLTTYRQYKLFRPWPSPILTVNWHEAAGTGQVESVDSVNVQLQTVGQAQVWKGESIAVLWECYVLGASLDEASEYEELHQFWQSVEKDISVPHLFTLPYDPAFVEGYTDFLSRLDYVADPMTPGWWRKFCPSQNESKRLTDSDCRVS